MNNNFTYIRNFRHLLLLIHLLGISLMAHSQDVVMHTQGLTKQEFLNPAYNSFKDYVSVTVAARHQWQAKVAGRPETYAADVYVPRHLSRLGLGLVVLNEKIGLRDKTSVQGTLAHNVRLGETSFLAFGYGLGVESTAYDQDRIITDDSNFVPGLYDLNSMLMNVSLGLFYYSPHFFAGASSYGLVNKKRISDEWYLPGFDFNFGTIHQLNRNIVFRPDLVIKYYPVSEVEYRTQSLTQDKFTEPVFDLSANFLFGNKVWLGTSRRFKQAQIFSFDIILADRLKLGYTYELGIGKGLNQFDSQGVRLAWNLLFDNARNGFTAASGRHRPSNTNYLYK